jgi:LuxR family maltose regulon positive regulatory protein
LNRGLELLTLTTIPESQVSGFLTLARLRCAQGHASAALEACRAAEDRWPHAASRLSARKARIWLVLAGENSLCAAAVDRWAAEHRLDPERAYQLDLDQLTLARWIITRLPAFPGLDHPSRRHVFPFLARQRDLAQRRQRISWELETLILLALAHAAQQDATPALAWIQEALTLAEPEGYTRLFLEFGRSLAPLLRLSLERSSSTGYAARLLEIFEAEAASPSRRGREVSPVAQLVEPLSARELDVLRLLAEGLTNRQIAQRLHLSPNTIRIHTSSIYGKLGVENRTQAVSRARDLGFLR